MIPLRVAASENLGNRLTGEGACHLVGKPPATCVCPPSVRSKSRKIETSNRGDHRRTGQDADDWQDGRPASAPGLDWDP